MGDASSSASSISIRPVAVATASANPEEPLSPLQGTPKSFLRNP